MYAKGEGDEHVEHQSLPGNLRSVGVDQHSEPGDKQDSAGGEGIDLQEKSPSGIMLP